MPPQRQVTGQGVLHQGDVDRVLEVRQILVLVARVQFGPPPVATFANQRPVVRAFSSRMLLQNQPSDLGPKRSRLQDRPAFAGWCR